MADGAPSGADIDRALGILAGLIAGGATDALPLFVRLEREAAARDDAAAVLARARALAAQGAQKS